MKNVTISIPDELWERLKGEAADHRMSMNAYIREQLRDRLYGATDGPETVGARIVRLANELGPAPGTWKWNREELYEDAG